MPFFQISLESMMMRKKQFPISYNRKKVKEEKEEMENIFLKENKKV